MRVDGTTDANTTSFGLFIFNSCNETSIQTILLKIKRVYRIYYFPNNRMAFMLFRFLSTFALSYRET